MNAVNVVQLFILVWTFTAVCQADKDLSLSCDDVTGSVGKEATFTCRVSLLKNDCCIKMYKIQCSDIKNDTAICKKKPPVNCEQSNSFTCSYTPTTAMTEQFRFFVQTTCGAKTTEFTVNITGPTTPEIVTGAPGKNEEVKKKDLGSKDRAIAAVVGCFIIIIIIVIITIKIFCKMKPNFTKHNGFQKRMFLCIRHDEDNSDHPEDVI